MQFPRVDVPASIFKIQVPEQGGADVDGEPVVDQFGGQQPAEIVRGEARGAEVRVVPASSVQRPRSMTRTVAGEMTRRTVPSCRWNRNSRARTLYERRGWRLGTSEATYEHDGVVEVTYQYALGVTCG